MTLRYVHKYQKVSNPSQDSSRTPSRAIQNQTRPAQLALNKDSRAALLSSGLVQLASHKYSKLVKAEQWGNNRANRPLVNKAVSPQLSVKQMMFSTAHGARTAITTDNQTILKDALEALHEVQEGTLGDASSFAAKTAALADRVKSLNGHIDEETKAAIKNLYEEFGELSFRVNPVLREAWDRCLASTRDAAARSRYGRVGPKFRSKFQEVLHEIAVAHPALVGLINNIITDDVNKEHMVNKGLGGLQTASINLMDAGVGERQRGGRGSLSELHKELHRLKSGGASYDYNSMLPVIRQIIEQVQATYDPDAMGTLTLAPPAAGASAMPAAAAPMVGAPTPAMAGAGAGAGAGALPTATGSS
ncbi:hypothetical protein [Roseivirga thermotolerans]|uniref:Uncharacterized protein n=1 Tax=Roseivirga thermotolerans TaxID=1758176 RepID=A0ABQ3I668_9BACT|nr:hypothetical protein [Roseivirga thermotolerans]GHE60007.1 hypothetical protein GCM10011340_13470 [Roseivirga thermotolerans]